MNPEDVDSIMGARRVIDRLTAAMTRWGWSHCTTEVELIAQIDSMIAEREAAWSPAEAAWSGLARDLVMWMDLYSGPNMTPRNLFRHLERCGRPVPQWLRDEPELKALDHVPSKGTRAVIIYRAVLDGLRNTGGESTK